MDTTSDKKFLMVFAVVMAVLTVIGVSVAIIANVAGSLDYKKSSGQVKLAAERIAPVGKVNLASEAGTQTVAVVEEDDGEDDPEALYNVACAACHAAGVAGAPKFADVAAWDPRLNKGFETLVNNAINGIGVMPARGGSSLSDEQIEATVEYMLDAVE